jgi:hypothetical protein
MLRRALTGSVLGLCGILLQAGVAAADPILSIRPGETVGVVGDTFTLDIMVEDVSDLAAIGFDVLFDASLLSLDPTTGITEGDFLSSAGTAFFFSFYDPTFDPTMASFGVALDALSAGASTPLGTPRRIGSLTFTAIGPGVSFVSIANATLLDIVNAQLLADGEPFTQLATTQTPGRVEIGNPMPPTASVPEPATALLMLGGVAMFAAKRRIRARTSV